MAAIEAQTAPGGSDLAVRHSILRALSVSRRWVLLVTSAAIVVLAGWIAYLAVELHTPASHSGWRTTWIGFDVMELAAYSAAAWAAWRRRWIAVPALYATAVLLVCDAWFDTTLAWHTSAWRQSLLLALIIEIPSALLLAFLAHRTAATIRLAWAVFPSDGEAVDACADGAAFQVGTRAARTRRVRTSNHVLARRYTGRGERLSL